MKQQQRQIRLEAKRCIHKETKASSQKHLASRKYEAKYYQGQEKQCCCNTCTVAAVTVSSIVLEV
jgi:hypothetical protein